MRIRLLPVVMTTVVVAACSPLSRKDGSLEVFVAGEEAASFDTLVIEVLDGDGRVARLPEPAMSFSGSFRFESAPTGTYQVKVTALAGAAVVLEGPTAVVTILDGESTGRWVRLNADPGEDDDGDLVRNGEDPCPLVAGEAGGDTDGDGSADACDNCPDVSNPAQADGDSDGTGDSCDIPDPGDPPEPMHYPAVADLFSSRCATTACHSGVAPQGGLDLTVAAGYAELVDVPSSAQPAVDRIEPGDVAASYLYRKVTAEASITGTVMPPPPLTPLSSGELALIRKWIEDGAIP